MLRPLKRWFRLSKKSGSVRSRMIKLLDKPSDDSLCEDERDLIFNALDLSRMPIDELMIPRADIIAISKNIPFQQLINALIQVPYSKVPVFGRDLDDLRGYIHTKDTALLRFENQQNLFRHILRPLLYVPPSKKTLHVLLEMRRLGIPMAIIVDEQGGVDGLVTDRDIVRHLIGQSDQNTYKVFDSLHKTEDGTYITDARIPLEILKETFHVTFEESEKNEDIETLGGLIVDLLGRVPNRCEVIKHASGMVFEVLEADPRRILKVRIRSTPKEPQKKTSLSKKDPGL